MIKIVIVTGASGAGKTVSLHTFEELGFYIVENIPFGVIKALLKNFKEEKTYKKVVLTVASSHAQEIIDLIRKTPGFECEIVTLTATPAELQKRFKLTRHVHPLQIQGYSLTQAISIDQIDTNKLREISTLFIDTTKCTVSELRKIIFQYYDEKSDKHLLLSFTSFGYKYGNPIDADLIIDTRVIPNPYYVAELKELTGQDKAVVDYIMSFDDTKVFLKKIIVYLDYYLAKFETEGKSFYSIAIACSGGQHRSVAVTEYLANYYKRKYRVQIMHRDIRRKNT